MLPRFAVTPVLLASLFLTACGGDDKSSEAPATVAPDYLMLTEGNRWVYDHSFGVAEPTTYRSTQLVTLDTATLLDGSPVLRMTDRVLFGGAGLQETRIRLSPGMLARVFDADDGEPMTSRVSMPLLRLPLQVGDHYELYYFPNEPTTFDNDDDSIAESVTTRGWIAGIAREKVTVPAGTFDTLRVTRKEEASWTNSSDGSPGSSVSTELTWYAAGIGPVMRQQDWAKPLTFWWKLTGYRVGSRSSDTTPPHVLAVVPEASSVQPISASTHIGLVLSEPIDYMSLELTVQDAAQQLVPGDWSKYPTDVWFTPDTPLVAGTYTVTLHGMSDTLGNALVTPYSWSFTMSAD